MKVQKLASGLIVPEVKPQKSHRKYSAHEVQDQEARDKVYKILVDLWNVLSLSTWSTMSMDRQQGVHEAYELMYDHLAELLLGPDRPSFEKLT